MLDAALSFFLEHVSEALLAALVFLLGLLLRAVRRLPGLLLDFARDFAEEAKKTPGAGDDMAAKVLVMVAEALVRAFEKTGIKGK